jgi:uncharacterized protein YkwD
MSEPPPHDRREIRGSSFAYRLVKFGAVIGSRGTPAFTLATVPADFSDGPGGLDEPVLVPRHRKASRFAFGIGIVLALLMVGAVAFGGTVLLAGIGGAHHSAAQRSGGSGPADAGTPVVEDPSAVVPDPTTEAPADPSPSPSKPRAAKPMPPMDLAHMSAENAVLALVNAERAKAGCGSLSVDGRLAGAARAHSMDMVVRDYFSHTTPDGVTFDKRITAAGYKWSLVGENIAAGQPDPTAVMRAWMNSPGHRANILNCRFRQIGIGLAFDSPRRPVWTQDFGTPR